MSKVKPAAWSAAEESVAVSVHVRSWKETPLAGPLIDAVRATLTFDLCVDNVPTPPGAVPPSSCNCTVTIAVPKTSAAGVYVSVRRPRRQVGSANTGALSLLTMKSNCLSGLSAGCANVGGPSNHRLWTGVFADTIGSGCEAWRNIRIDHRNPLVPKSIPSLCSPSSQSSYS